MRRAARIALLGALAAGLAPSQAQLQHRRRVSSPVAYYDDADPATPGVLSISEYYSSNRLEGGRDISFPSTYLNLGLHRRFDVSVEVDIVRSEFQNFHVNGLGDSYLGSKILLMPGGRRRPALAVKPTLEVLGRASLANNPLVAGRNHAVLPLVAQQSFDNYRLYYMAGYNTRGILFHSLAWELNRWSRVTPLVIVSSSRLTRELALVSELGLNRSRSDFVGGFAIALHPAWSVFANAGRSFGRLDLNSAAYQFTGGMSFNLRLWGER